MVKWTINILGTGCASCGSDSGSVHMLKHAQLNRLDIGLNHTYRQGRITQRKLRHNKDFRLSEAGSDGKCIIGSDKLVNGIDSQISLIPMLILSVNGSSEVLISDVEFIW